MFHPKGLSGPSIDETMPEFLHRSLAAIESALALPRVAQAVIRRESSYETNSAVSNAAVV